MSAMGARDGIVGTGPLFPLLSSLLFPPSLSLSRNLCLPLCLCFSLSLCLSPCLSVSVLLSVSPAPGLLPWWVSTLPPLPWKAKADARAGVKVTRMNVGDGADPVDLAPGLEEVGGLRVS